MTRNIVVLGDGAWGRALAHVFRDGSHHVDMWSRQNDDQRPLSKADAVVVALPAQAVRSVLRRLDIPKTAAIIITAKGIEQGSQRFMHQVAQHALPHSQCYILSGPSFASDVQKGLPTAVTLAGPDLTLATDWAQALSRPNFRIYASDDLMGVAMGGALKNVLAIACGIADGQNLGESARAALIARGFSELLRLGRALEARQQTLMGLSGLGDLLLTCSSPQSRNYNFGRHIGEGQSVDAALAASRGVVEGVYTAQVAFDIAHEAYVDMPIICAIAAIITGHSSPQAEIDKLLSRPVTHEFL